jgi:formylglycine-generating enzyme required for sulfatase activity
MQTLRGGADRRTAQGNANGEVESDEAFFYARRHTSQLVEQAYGEIQTPELLCRTSNKLSLATLKPLPAQVANSLGMSLVLIPHGRFSMGSPDGHGRGREHENERPQHEVVIPDGPAARPKLPAGGDVGQYHSERQ